jgi:hypothetical protein
MDRNYDKKNPFQGTIVSPMHNQKKWFILRKKILIREEILLKVPGIGIPPLLPVAPVTGVIS